jgi:undecaprenyl diphosphate synthase
MPDPVPGAPRHLAVVPDGNRRWARARGLGPADGHRAGIANVGAVADAAFAAGVEVFTFWWGSPANLTKRAPAEVAAIADVLDRWLRGEGAALIARWGCRFDAIGRWPELCPQIRPGVEAAAAAAGDGPRRLVLLMGYDGREEILDAAERLGGRPVDADAFGRALWTGDLPPVDLLIRTGGEPHLSAGFLLWRIAEAQLAFPEDLWPAFGPPRLREEVERFAGLQRRHGA